MKKYSRHRATWALWEGHARQPFANSEVQDVETEQVTQHHLWVSVTHRPQLANLFIWSIQTDLLLYFALLKCGGHRIVPYAHTQSVCAMDCFFAFFFKDKLVVLPVCCAIFDFIFFILYYFLCVVLLCAVQLQLHWVTYQFGKRSREVRQALLNSWLDFRGV